MFPFQDLKYDITLTSMFFLHTYRAIRANVLRLLHNVTLFACADYFCNVRGDLKTEQKKVHYLCI